MREIIDELPADFSAYNRILFVVPNDDARKQQARATFKQLKAQGLAVQVHHIN